MTSKIALLIMLLDKYSEQGYQHSLLEVQKLAYFLQEAGEPLKLNPHTDTAIIQEEKTTQSPTQLPTQSNSPILKLLSMLQDKTLASGELMQLLNLKHRANFRKNYLHPALKNGYIEQTIPEKPNSRLQKYRLTGKKYEN